MKVITAITNNKDNLRDDVFKGKAEYVAFLDEVTKSETFGSDIWEIRDCYNAFKEPRRNAKIHKIMPHMFVDTDISIWIDANISLKVDPNVIAKEWLKDKDIAVCKHFARTNCYDEAKLVTKMGLDKKEYIEDQMAKYKKEGYESDEFCECNVIVRRHTDKINRLNERWWAEICSHSSRDQLSFNYVFRDNVNIIDGNVR